MKKTLLVLALAGLSSAATADSLLYGGVMAGQSEYDGENSTAASFHLGTGLLPILGVEGGYADHGSFEFKDKDDVDARSFFVAVRPSIDFGPLHVYGRVGAHQWDLSGGESDDGVDMMYGLGAEYFLFGPLAVGAAYNVYKVGGEDISNFSVSATVHFF